MPELTLQEMTDQLLAGGLAPTVPVPPTLNDPLCDMPITVTLDELRPYELNPRLTRNPLYEEIKASIRERGLDAPPPITRRPGADHYIIRNGGNTRLAVLRELWSETRNERFFRISCVFRPWPERGEVVALTGHLAESELHGGLSFIERALGVGKARELYERENGKPLSQSELARSLSADGFPVGQSHISRMRDAVRYLLPAIPNVLYGGLGRHPIERLIALYKTTGLAWRRNAHGQTQNLEFETFFHDVLAAFDTSPKEFSLQRVRNGLIGEMAKVLGTDYNTLELDIDGIEHGQRMVTTPPPVSTDAGSTLFQTPSKPTPSAPEDRNIPERGGETVSLSSPCAPTPSLSPVLASASLPNNDLHRFEQEHIVLPKTRRLQAIRQLVPEHTSGDRQDFVDTLPRSRTCGALNRPSTLRNTCAPTSCNSLVKLPQKPNRKTASNLSTQVSVSFVLKLKPVCRNSVGRFWSCYAS
jgi:ParB family protein of integrating conjugative element (PFGI_1 class)